METKPEILDLGTITIVTSDYRLFLHEDLDTLKHSNMEGYCDFHNKEIHISSRYWTVKNKVSPDWGETKKLIMHELGHALHREHHALRVLLVHREDEGMAEFSVIAMDFWDRYGPMLKKKVMPVLKRWSTKEYSND